MQPSVHLHTVQTTPLFLDDGSFWKEKNVRIWVVVFRTNNKTKKKNLRCIFLALLWWQRLRPIDEIFRARLTLREEKERRRKQNANLFLCFVDLLRTTNRIFWWNRLFDEEQVELIRPVRAPKCLKYKEKRDTNRPLRKSQALNWQLKRNAKFRRRSYLILDLFSKDNWIYPETNTKKRGTSIFDWLKINSNRFTSSGIWILSRCTYSANWSSRLM